METTTMMDVVDDVDDLAEELYKLITSELAPGRHQYGVDISLRQYDTGPYREQVQTIGEKNGCHTCGTVLARDANQPWIGDHIPPTELGGNAQRVLHPQCDVCSNTQSGLVKALKNRSRTLDSLSAFETKLIYGGRKGPSVSSSGPRVSLDEGLAIQQLGTRNGCHSCSVKLPRAVYHADHIVPQEFTTSYMQEIIQRLGVTQPSPQLRPQCPRCSGRQGGTIANIASKAQQYAKLVGIVCYKF